MTESALTVRDPRLSAEFERRLSSYMGGYDLLSPLAGRYRGWYEDHAGGRSDWFRQDLIWRVESGDSLSGCRVLDFGCGTGSSSVVLAEHKAVVIGVDTEQLSLDVATQRANDLGLRHACSFIRIPYFGAATTLLPFHDHSFDLCTLIGVLEHMLPSERKACVAEISRVLKSGGKLFIFDTPNRAYPLDHHTTHLWFLGWMPRLLAARYATWRGRFDSKQDFARYGGNGVSRQHIDRLFPRGAWHVYYERSLEEVAKDFGLLVKHLPGPAMSWKATLSFGLINVATEVLQVVRRLGCRPTYWAASHIIGLRKV
jgi:ubiquinone/menaquinone biosynthesis C-methylase UbiE